ncbi:hypothetical protein K402DRAFT_461475 [Aulographum hederae CBS 113979]|uniref:Protein transport protein SEC31 n=1 Tax=Aulographum hederae CBS 113979 TaxID=1176131 RepID=A0A6G1H7L1_9PEZI|nr:hypothetical protein K402DRAFT_461475 [Aulographum hederae CBS 113979]
MVRLREIPRTAAFAWSTGAAPPLIATGTKAGAVDSDFSSETQLEIWELDLGNTEQGVELQPRGSVSVNSRFHDIAWGQSSEDHPRGIIAGALENGALDLWDAEKLLKGDSDSLIARTTKHSGAIKAIQFNPYRHEILASAGAKGELYITDVNSPESAFRLGTTAARADDFEALDWNKRVPHILVTGSSGGFVTVWDLKTKKESLTLNNLGRKAVSAVAWDPDVPTKLMTAIPNDQDPFILMWDLRNSNAPERTLKAHDQGVLSLSWCPQDGDLLLSCGKDNRTICWNPHTGQTVGEFPVVTNWTFQTRWNPHNPSLLATASFDGKICVQTVQNTNSAADPASAVSQNLDGEDFFAKAQSQPQGVTFSLPKAPKWLERPVGVTFGFGGKLVKFGVSEPGSRQSKISISTFVVDEAIGTATQEFEETLQKGDLASICEDKIAKAPTDEEKADWTVIETLIASNPRKAIVDYLGISKDTAAANGVESKSSDTNGEKSTKEDGDFFGGGEENDSFLADLAATKGAKTNNPFQIFTGKETDADKQITRALMLGSFDEALDVCLKEDRLSDAFMIAICGGQKCIDKAQAAYFKRKADGPNYLRLLASVVGKNLWDVVYNADLENWKDVMATLCTFADEAEFPDLCEALGDRLEESGSETSRKDASFCYLAGSKLEKVAGNWAQELEEMEEAGLEAEDSDNSFSVHARSLQHFIEKVTIFRQVVKFQDSEQKLAEGWKLAPVYAKYAEYADLVASHGQLQVAEKYLDLLPEQYPAAEVARNRIKQATRKAAPTQRQPAAANVTAQRGQRVMPSYGQTPAPGVSTQQPTASPYAPMGAATPSQPMASPYAPPGQSSYAPAGYQPPQPTYGQSYQPPGAPSQPYGGYPSQAVTGPPPRAFTSSPSMPPPPKGPVSNWNDTPDFGSKPPTSRRATPAFGAPPVSSPFASQGGAPPTGPPMGAARATPPLAPPPKGPPRVTSPGASSPSSSMMGENRPPSSAANAYAPPLSSQLQQPMNTGPQSIPRGPSPYNPPPAGGASGNRYAPAPGSQPSGPPPPAGGAPPPRNIAPPPNSYSMPQQQQQQQQTFSPPIQQQAPPPGPPPSGPPRAGAPPGGPPRGGVPPQAAAPDSRPGSSQAQKAASAARKYPPGDRSHIPPNAQSVLQIFTNDMQRVKAVAPPNFKPQVLDTEKRINILFDLLNNDEVRPEIVSGISEVAQSIQARNWPEAEGKFQEVMKTSAGEGSQWMTGVKRLIAMSKNTPA